MRVYETALLSARRKDRGHLLLLPLVTPKCIFCSSRLQVSGAVARSGRKVAQILVSGGKLQS